MEGEQAPDGSEQVSIADFDLSSQLADILNEPLFEALDSKRRPAPADLDDNLAMDDLELDFGFGEVDLQKIMEEEMGSHAKRSSPLPQPPALHTPPAPLLDATPASSTTPVYVPAATPPLLSGQAASAATVPSVGLASSPGAAEATRFELDDDEDGGQAKEEDSASHGEQQQQEEAEEAPRCAVIESDVGEDGDVEGEDEEAEASELTPDHSLIQEITDTIEGRYLDSLNELKLRELVRHDESSGDADAGTDGDTKRAQPEQEEHAHGEEMSQEMARELEAELNGGLADIDKLRQVARQYIIPETLRPALWKLLLGADRKPSDSMAGWEELVAAPPTPEEEKLIQACRDTRPELPEFRDEGVSQRMARILRFYCKRRYVKYREGLYLNELLAQFLMLKYPLDMAFNCFDTFISKHAPLTFVEDPSVHTCINQLFRLLVLYHDQPLCLFLDQNNLSHFRFSSQWFSSLFTCIYDMDEVYTLWDFLCAHGDPFFPYYYGLAFLLNKRSAILRSSNQQAVLSELARVSTSSAEEIHQLIDQALKLEQRTPRAFRQQLYAATFQTQEWGEWVKRCLFTADPALSTPTCLHMSAPEVAEAASGKGLKFLVLDVRTDDEYGSGHLPTAFHLPTRLLLEKPEEFKRLLDGLTQLKSDSMHFTFMGASQVDTFLELIILQFLQKGFNHVSVIHGGYEALHSVLVPSASAPGQGNTELMDHDRDKCLVCANTPGTKTSSLPSTSSISSAFFSTLLAGSSGAPKYQDRTAYSFSSSPPSSSSSAGLSTLSSSPPPAQDAQVSSSSETPTRVQPPPNASAAPSSSSSSSSSTTAPTTSPSLRTSGISLPTSLVSTFTSGFSRVTRMPSIPFSLGGRAAASAPAATPADLSAAVPTANVAPVTTQEKQAVEKIDAQPRLFTIDDDEEDEDDQVPVVEDEEGDEETVPGGDEEAHPRSEDSDAPAAAVPPPITESSQPVSASSGEAKVTSGHAASRWGSGLFSSWGRNKAPKPADPSAGSGAGGQPTNVVTAETEGTNIAHSVAAPAAPASNEKSAPQAAAEEGNKTAERTTRKPGLWQSLNSIPSLWGRNKQPQHKIGEYVRLDQYVESHQAWAFFACKKVVLPTLHPWYLVVTGDELLELKVHEEQRFLVAVERVHSLENIVKITFKKRTPKLLTFLYSPESGDSSPAAACDDAMGTNADAQRPTEGAGATNTESPRSNDAGGADAGQAAAKQQLASAQYVVERPTECIATVTRAVDAFVTRQAQAASPPH